MRIAILGLGGRGGDHLKLAAQIPDIEVVTFCDPDETQLRKRGAEFEQLTGRKPVSSRICGACSMTRVSMQ